MEGRIVKIAVGILLLMLLLPLASAGEPESQKIPPDPVIRTVGPGIRLVLIPGGSFLRGRVSLDYFPERNNPPVTVDAFYMGETEVTIAQYIKFLNDAKPTENERKKWIVINGEDSWHYIGGTSKNQFEQGINSTTHISYSGGSYYADAGWGDRPVVNVSWFGADAFCAFYQLRLPTALELEYAAGGPEHTIYSWGDIWDNKACCNYLNHSKGKPGTMKVGSFPPNGYGLYDITGNVAEYSTDYLMNNFPEVDNKSIEFYKSKRRVIQNSSWCEGAASSQCSSFNVVDIASVSNMFGFRVACD
jgi:formylglycine-generating enzyme